MTNQYHPNGLIIFEYNKNYVYRLSEKEAGNLDNIKLQRIENDNKRLKIVGEDFAFAFQWDQLLNKIKIKKLVGEELKTIKEVEIE